MATNEKVTFRMPELKPQDLFKGPIRIVNIGLESFARDCESLGVAVIHVDWRPPADGDLRIADLLSKLSS